ncbi:expressed protein [Chlorella variabilis]|uniref:Expressed protein n=1 Tax=Chlorella variabilis TaxID=554065 RepID=E1ZJ85_CHLVA|nr:expressed protein [Chlorella variabilis]EFN53952.1 expressed protein [Chlorella variabilis]|eukprot:XP_005846054.1 expressed protein [Chlorella variabilis]
MTASRLQRRWCPPRFPSPTGSTSTTRPGRYPSQCASTQKRSSLARAAMRCAPTPPASSSPTASPRWQSAAATTLTMSTWGPGRACCRPAPPRPSRPGEPPSHACPPACRPAAAAPGAGDQGLPSQGRQVPERHQLRPVLQPDERPLHVPGLQARLHLQPR